MIPMNEKILVVEDEAKIANLLKRGLAEEGYEVESAQDGAEGLDAALNGAFDLIVLDIGLPELDGMEVCRQLRAKGRQTPIIFLTARDSVHDKVLGLQQGADDYLTKPFDMGVLLARLEALLRRARAAGPAPTAAVREFGPFVLDEVRGELLRDGQAQALNAQEYRLLCYLAAHPNRVLDRDEILDQVWGYESGTTTRTVDVHVAKLRHRLGESDQPRHIQTIRGRGYQFKP